MVMEEVACRILASKGWLMEVAHVGLQGKKAAGKWPNLGVLLRRKTEQLESEKRTILRS